MLARGAQGLGPRQAAAKGVAVGVLVPEDQDLVVRVDELFDLVVVMSGFAPGGGYLAPPS